jgi:hypothetical protein
MEAGSTTYTLEVMAGENPTGKIPDLTHLQKALEEQGFRTEYPFSQLQAGQVNLAHIHTQPSFESNSLYATGAGSFVKTDGTSFQLVVGLIAGERLREFAENYCPIPLTGH